MPLLFVQPAMLTGSLPPFRVRVFIASSSEGKPLMRTIAKWLRAMKVVALQWDDADVFKPSDFIADRLTETAHNVEGAILVFTADDVVLRRKKRIRSPRDNVLVEYGIFSSALGRARTIVCRTSDSTVPVDLDGIVHVSLGENDARAKRAVCDWAKTLAPRITERYDLAPDEAQVLVRYWRAGGTGEGEMVERLRGLGLVDGAIEEVLTRTPKAEA